MTGEGRGEIQGKLTLVRVSGELELTGFCCVETTEQIFNFSLILPGVLTLCELNKK